MSTATRQEPAVRLDELTGLTPLSATTTTLDPAPVYEKLHAQWGPIAPVELEPGVNAWLVTDRELALLVLKNEHTYSRDAKHWTALQDGRVSAGTAAFFAPPMSENSFYRDGKVRARLRRAVDDAFQVVDQHALAVTMRTACDTMLARIAPQGQADLVAAYTAAVPQLGVAALFDLPGHLADRLLGYATAIFANNASTPDAFKSLVVMMQELIEHRFKYPGTDMLSALVHHPVRLTPQELVATAQMVQSAGHAGAEAWTTTTFQYLLGNVEDGYRVTRGRLGVDEALDKVLIYDSPVSKAPARFVTTNTILESVRSPGSGRTLHTGDAVICDVAQVSRSSHRDADPIWDSTNRDSLAFGAGPHQCPAKTPARIIVKTAVERALIRLPALKLAIPPDHLAHGASPWTSSAPAMPVTYQPTNPGEWT